MLKKVITFMALLAFITACSMKPHYKTTKGKKKNRYYNSIQYQKP